MIWPPTLVEEDRPRAKRAAHVLYGSLIIAFVTYVTYSIVKASSKRNHPDLVSEFKDEGYKFPVVEICGNTWAERTHHFVDKKCYFCDYPDNEECDCDTACDVELVDECLVFNSEQTEKGRGDESYDMNIEIEGSFEGEPGKYCEYLHACDGLEPESYTMILRGEVGDGWQTQFEIPADGDLTYVTSLQVRKYLDGSEKKIIDVTAQPFLQWYRPKDTDEDNKKVLYMSFRPSDHGVHYLTEKNPLDPLILAGALGGLFTYVGMIFFCFFQQEQLKIYPNCFGERIGSGYEKVERSLRHQQDSGPGGVSTDLIEKHETDSELAKGKGKVKPCDEEHGMVHYNGSDDMPAPKDMEVQVVTRSHSGFTSESHAVKLVEA